MPQKCGFLFRGNIKFRWTLKALKISPIKVYQVSALVAENGVRSKGLNYLSTSPALLSEIRYHFASNMVSGPLPAVTSLMAQGRQLQVSSLPLDRIRGTLSGDSLVCLGRRGLSGVC